MAVALAIVLEYLSVDAVTIALIFLSLIVIIFVTYSLSDRMIMAIRGAYGSDEPAIRKMRDIVGRFCGDRRIPIPIIAVLRRDLPDVYVDGVSKRKCLIIVTTGAIARFNDDELSEIAIKELANVQSWAAFNMAVLNLIDIPLARWKEWSVYFRHMRNGVLPPKRLDDHIAFRKADERDFTYMYRIGVDAFQASTGFVSLHRLAGLIGKPTAVSIVAEYDGRPAGFMIGHVKPGAVGINGHIDTIVVDGPYREKGVGAGLTGAFIEALEHYGCRQCCLEVWQHNHAAIALYEKVGFARRAVFEDYYKDGRDALIMCKDLVAR